MEVVKSLLKPKPTPQQQMREWQRRLRNKGRNIERQIRDVQKEEKKVEKAIRDAAKALAKELVQSRKAVNHLYENKAQLNSISMHLGKIVGNAHRLHRIYLSR
ncbi:vacuolar protein sorting-associated protein 24 homolog 1-like [Aegilops tauschii subsp. strangulata]|uniref:vacuolar protein sorting-associated protein 24 homolog 1-like n=1 Tax=Aegilops tauschii subsp. strangulata TaxID=200361 RepID=UPI001ABC7AA3|nr:vacuolar protein sorting-associated protein 24 homolog 1-like [Aegilops tauschii subsp. strangulata]